MFNQGTHALVSKKCSLIYILNLSWVGAILAWAAQAFILFFFLFLTQIVGEMSIRDPGTLLKVISWLKRFHLQSNIEKFYKIIVFFIMAIVRFSLVIILLTMFSEHIPLVKNIAIILEKQLTSLSNTKYLWTISIFT